MPDYVVHLSTFLRFLELHIFYSGNEVDVNGEAVIPSKVGCNFFLNQLTRMNVFRVDCTQSQELFTLCESSVSSKNS